MCVCGYIKKVHASLMLRLSTSYTFVKLMFKIIRVRFQFIPNKLSKLSIIYRSLEKKLNLIRTFVYIDMHLN